MPLSEQDLYQHPNREPGRPFQPGRMSQRPAYKMPTKRIRLRSARLFGAAAAVILATAPGRAQVFHVSTAQGLQNALTGAASNGLDNTIYITNGYYAGNFNYNSPAPNTLTVLAEPGVTNTHITIDGAGLGQGMYLASTGIGNITVEGITFLRNSGSPNLGALSIAAGSGAGIWVQGCRFVFPTNANANTDGIGLALDSGLNATVTNCVATGVASGGDSVGIYVSGVTATVNVQGCKIATNNAGGVRIVGPHVANVTGNDFTGNYGPGGGGGANLDQLTSAAFTGNVFTGNSGSGQGGGGVRCGSGIDASFTGNTFRGNQSDGGWGGGGILCSDGATATLSGNAFVGNSVTSSDTSGGGVYCSGAATLNDNIFTNNSTAGAGDSVGAGVYCSGGGTLTGNTFIGNSATGGEGAGGGAYCSQGSYTISNNRFEQNAASTGGGLYATGPTVTLQDNLVLNNSQAGATSQGGGIWVDATSELFMINNTITGNTAAGSGGGVAFRITGVVEVLNVYNNIIWGNSASSYGGDAWLAGTGERRVFAFNDAHDMFGVWDVEQNNIDASPQFVNPASGDYRLQATSPCRNAGTTNAPSVPATDLDGNPRTVLGTADIGCYELNPRVTGIERNADGSISLAFVGLPNSTARVWATTNLTPPISWQPIFMDTNTGPYGVWQFTDTNAMMYPASYYRFSTP